jgi:hypothetical protein
MGASQRSGLSQFPIIGSLAISPAELWENKWAALAMLGAGLVICAAWVQVGASLVLDVVAVSGLSVDIAPGNF